MIHVLDLSSVQLIFSIYSSIQMPAKFTKLDKQSPEEKAVSVDFIELMFIEDDSQCIRDQRVYKSINLINAERKKSGLEEKTFWELEPEPRELILK